MNAGEYLDRARTMVERDRKIRHARDVYTEDELREMTKRIIEENREALDRLAAHDRGEPYHPRPR